MGKTVNTIYGTLRGLRREFPANYSLLPIEAYFGLQYGLLKGTTLRFMPPKNPIEKFDFIRKFVKYEPVCPQRKILTEKEISQIFTNLNLPQLRRIMEYTKYQTEECLRLNLFVPVRDWNDTRLMPVMVFIHGESYDVGTGNAYDGSVLASYGGIIVVTVNYRLGVLGFLSTGDSHARGNYALLDLLAILTWIKDNIAAFGGDKDRVTLFGHGYGAALINVFLFSNMARDETYFQRVILQSGSALSSWAMSVNPSMCAKRMAINVNCTGSLNNSERLINCLRSKSVEELVENVPLAPKYYSCFAPTLNSQGFVSQSIQELMKDKRTRFAKTPIIFGITRDEAYSYLTEEDIRNGIGNARKAQILRTFVQNIYHHQRQKIFNILDHEYASWEKTQDDSTRRINIINMLSDALYVAPLIEVAKEHSKHSDTYLYVFSHSTVSESYPDWIKGAHGDDLPYTFGAPLVGGISPFPTVYTDAEKILSENIMQFWTNFAKTGDPNLPEDNLPANAFTGRSRNQGIRWWKYDTGSQMYLAFGEAPGKEPIIRSHYRGKEMALWMNLLPKINVSDREGNTPDADELEHYSNLSTFDSSDRLVKNFNEIFPSPPPMPPTPPPNDKPYDTTDDGTITNDPFLKYSVDLPRIQLVTTTHKLATPVERLDDIKGRETNIDTPPIPLSITVAVGCSLLFLNLLILAGVFYQRKRIRELRNTSNSNRGDGGDKQIQQTFSGDVSREPSEQEMASLMQITHEDKERNMHLLKTNSQEYDVNSPVYKTIKKMSPPQLRRPNNSAISTNLTLSISENCPAKMLSNKGGQFAPNQTSQSIRPGHLISTRPPAVDRSPTSPYQHLTRANQNTSNNAVTIV
ncbi:hypothetical protein CHS0354_038986 [Potamilus streckersoni]|uniref:Carboxylesterase type B domain-containing protein n=1 Tax=Potamilus streckersoni TaxID=2493646 RepID=A0AAE0VNI3_9BIVA|nr:hypothetical protein CHS0354_038986 [Potamilus streckersoni]